jgi:hypothetical protein
LSRQDTTRDTSWHLVPWHHLATVGIPVTIMAVAITLSARGVDVNHSPVDPFDGMADTGAPAGLALVISTEGYVLVWSDKAGQPGARQRGSDVPCAPTCSSPGDWDTDGLIKALQHVKLRHPHADTLTVYPAANVPYRTLLDTLHAARSAPDDEPLFPFAVVSSERR